ncbi:uncharacterized protein LOC111312792 [Durio zibethinus]|uniref:Uncharacterized protein LOC111312792 n=1 Tax=Durio zibethinus TaxID=66656 RepID=A0A6P6AWH2_DURZI|nr:uncharacterized protein LOC111312792 [Durio zibethinus]XP_022769149.1 uncharacterized protein LOC111312792 [Durio zibethinus]XP_022769157.1 uncharacterized protein LOC111312792 [Durio zibethinus]XP_022769166.1 uncharacterized protein LOC111312792 [Durio zibethinus]XP_022769176.1 uncharacterized protein LOC111312792 [Durio zibethinus]XP_022769183.1 uncharacterized protein LOC111312792 [Durio zibethinus]XP_022769191.1 uncharacterized protein LOC111312792 [Durio zibethinus]XP_022769201.1 unc
MSEKTEFVTKDAEVVTAVVEEKNGPITKIQPPNGTVWKSLFKSKTYDGSLYFFTSSCSNGKIVVKPSIKVIEEGINSRNNSLIVQFLGKAPNYSQFQKVVNLLWGKKCAMEIKGAEAYLFFLRFSSNEVCSWVIESGPWHINHKPLILRRWKAGMNLDELNLNSIPVCVKLLNVSLELFNKIGLSDIASALGQLLCMDKGKTKQTQIKMAEVYVEIGYNDELPYEVEVDMGNGNIAAVCVANPWIPQKCTQCKMFGHTIQSCPLAPKDIKVVWVSKLVTEETQAEQKQLVPDNFTDQHVQKSNSVDMVKAKEPEVVNQHVNKFEILATLKLDEPKPSMTILEFDIEG